MVFERFFPEAEGEGKEKRDQTERISSSVAAEMLLSFASLDLRGTAGAAGAVRRLGGILRLCLRRGRCIGIDV